MIALAHKRLLATAAFAFVAQVCVYLAYVHVEDARETREVVRFRYERVRGLVALPALAFVRADGTASPADELIGRPTLLHFWATTCPPCRDELPRVLALAESNSELRVVAISVDVDWEPVRRFFDGRVPAEVVRDPSGIAVTHFGVDALPDSYLIDRRGIAVVRVAGARNWRGDGARRAIEESLTLGVGP